MRADHLDAWHSVSVGLEIWCSVILFAAAVFVIADLIEEYRNR
jgi:hypothetical protein